MARENEFKDPRNRIGGGLMDLNALLAAREADGPSGENLEYDFDFMQMQIAADRKSVV